MSNNTKNSVYENLDWSSIVSSIASEAIFEITKDDLEVFPSSQSLTQINLNYEKLNFFIENHDLISPQLIKSFSPLPSSKEPFLNFKHLKKSASIDKKSLNFCCLLIESLTALPVSIKKHQSISLPVWRKFKSASKLHFFRDEFRSLIDPLGRINYSYHPELSLLFKELNKKDSEIKASLAKISRTSLFKDALQFPEHDILHNRYVLAIKSDSYQSKLGAIISHSSSGLTLYVEPISIRTLDDKRIELEFKIEEFLLKKFIEFGVIVFSNFSLLEQIKQSLLSIDLIHSKAIFCIKNRFCKPQLTEKHEISIKGFFHPLIDNPITNHLEMSGDHRGLVISGPNTGGKTVALKSLTLCYLFLHYGLYLPATEAKIYPIKNLYFFSHDNQDISKGLSSFSSEAHNYLNLVDTLEDDSLIIIDEIFNSTSSEEASALAMGLLEEVLKIKKVYIFLSTHHTILKTNLYKNKCFLSSHVGFNELNHGPTFKLIYGEPGSSLALSIFQSLAKDYLKSHHILETAKEFLLNNESEYENLLGELSLKSQKLEKIINENNKIKTNLEAELQNSKHQLALQKNQSYNHYKSKIHSLIKKIEHYHSEITLTENRPSKKSFQKDISKFKSSFNQFDEEKESQESQKNQMNHRRPAIKISCDEFYFCSKIQKDVKLLKINNRKQLFQVSSGKINFWVKREDLYQTNFIQPTPSIQMIDTEVEKLEYDVRGMRLHEFQALIIPAIDNLLSESIPFVNIIHGHGNGILKAWIRNYLKGFNQLYWDHPEGNDGSTRVQLT